MKTMRYVLLAGMLACWACKNAKAEDVGMIDSIEVAKYGIGIPQDMDILSQAKSWLKNGVLQLPQNFNQAVGKDPAPYKLKSIFVTANRKDKTRVRTYFSEATHQGGKSWDGSNPVVVESGAVFQNGVLRLPALFGKYVGWEAKNVLPNGGNAVITFNVASDASASLHDVHIAFAKSIAGDLWYEMPLGGWGGGQSKLRVAKSGPFASASQREEGAVAVRVGFAPGVRYAQIRITLNFDAKRIKVEGLLQPCEFAIPSNAVYRDVKYFAFSSWNDGLVISNVQVAPYVDPEKVAAANAVASATLKVVNDVLAAAQAVDSAAQNGIWSQADFDKVNKIIAGVQAQVNTLKNLALSTAGSDEALRTAIAKEIQEELDAVMHAQAMLHEMIDKAEDDKEIADKALVTANEKKDAAAKKLEEAQKIAAGAPKGICSPADLARINDLVNQAEADRKAVAQIPDDADHEDKELFASLTAVVKSSLDSVTATHQSLLDLFNKETQEAAAQLSTDQAAIFEFNQEGKLSLPRLEGALKGWEVDHCLPVQGIGEVSFHYDCVGADVYVGFADAVAGPTGYLFILGGWGNSKSVLKDLSDGREVFVAEGAGLPAKAGDITISFDKRTGKISVKGLAKPFECTDANFKTKSHYFAFSSHTDPVIISNVDTSIDDVEPKGFDEIETLHVHENVTCGSRNGDLEMWSVADHGTTLAHYKQDSMAEKPWEDVKPKTGDGKDLRLETVSVSSDGVMVVLDRDGKCYQFDWDKEVFVPLAVGKDNEKLDLDIVAVGNAGSIWAIDVDAKSLYQHTDAGWVLREKGMAVDVAAGVDGTVVVLNEKGKAHLMLGEGKWKELDNDVMLTVAVGSKDHIYAINESNQLVRYEKDAWVVLNDKDDKPAQFFKDVAVNAAGSVFVLSCDGDMFNKGESGFEIVKPAKQAQKAAVKTAEHAEGKVAVKAAGKAEGKAVAPKKKTRVQAAKEKAAELKKAGKPAAKKATKAEKKSKKADHKKAAIEKKKAANKASKKPAAPKRGKKGAKAVKEAHKAAKNANSSKKKAEKKSAKKADKGSGKQAKKGAGAKQAKKPAGKISKAL